MKELYKGEYAIMDETGILLTGGFYDVMQKWCCITMDNESFKMYYGDIPRDKYYGFENFKGNLYLINVSCKLRCQAGKIYSVKDVAHQGHV